MVLTTHYLDEAEALADRVAVVNHGRVLDVGPPATIGGRDRARAVVSWVDADGPHRQETDTPTDLVVALSRAAGGEVPGLVVARPTLEDIYLGMIGAQA